MNGRPKRRLGALLVVLVLSIVVGAARPAQMRRDASGPAATSPKRSSSAIAIAAGGTLLLAVNPDSASLTLVDAASRSVLVELDVGLDPRTVAVDDAGLRAYVANRGSDSVSVVDLDARAVIAEVAVGYRPYGVAVSPAGDRLYVAEQGVDQVRILDALTLSTLAVVPTADRPSGLAISGDGRTLYVTHLLSDRITVLAARPAAVYLPLALADGARFVVPGGGALFAPEPRDFYNIPRDSPLQGRDASRSIPLRASIPTAGSGRNDALPSRYPSTTISLWPDSNLVQSIVLSPDGSRAYVPHTRANTNNRALTFDTTVFPIVSAIGLPEGTHLVGQHISLDTVDPPGVGLPFDAAITPDGGEIWVLNAASNDITVVDAETRQRVAHIEVGDNPRGIVLSPDGATAYVNNTLAGTVSAIDTATYTVTGEVVVAEIPLPPALLQGKRLFHSSDDPRLSLAQWISCNTCHYEGEQDGRTWTFGFAGPRNTTSLLGMVETYPLRWSGEWDESADSEFANRRENFGSGLIEGEMNCSLSPADCVNHPPNQGRSYDLDCLAAFIDSLPVPLSPAHARGEPLTGAEERGQALFGDPALGCVTCHPPPLYTDHLVHDVGTATANERIGPAYDTPSLRGLYDSAPYFHDGSAATLYEALTRPSPGSEHDVRGLLTGTEIADLVAFLMALPFE